jgi:uncharacterized protein DUF3597
MGIFSSILEKLRRHSNPQGSANPQQQQEARTQPAPTQQPGSPPMSNVDVEKVLSDLAAKKGGGGNWRTSIVDTMKLLDLDSSLENRKELARELGVNAGAHGSAEQNIALQKALMRKIAENGGKVPDSLKD